MAKKVLASFKGILSEAESRGLVAANIAAFGYHRQQGPS
jgi:hypothetical protein